MVTFVSNLGFDTSQLYQCMLNYGMDSGDHVILVRPEDDSARGEEAVEQIESMLRKVDPDITTEVVEVDPNNFDVAAEKLVDVLNRQDNELILNLGGGDRAILVALAMATVTTSTNVRAVTLLSDVTRDRQEIDLPNYPEPDKEKEREVLSFILDEAPVSNSEVVNELGYSESMVSRIISELEDKGYIKVTSEGRSNLIKPTLVSKLISTRI